MNEQDYLELRFINGELNRFGLELSEIFIQIIEEKSLIGTKNEDSHLKDHISYKVTNEGEKGGKIQYYFPDHGRLIEINYRKQKSRAKLSSRSTNESLWGIKQKNKSRVRKDTRWYNITVFSHINTLIGRLLYGFTESVRINLRNELNKANA
jgi:hypothetical protein